MTELNISQIKDKKKSKASKNKTSDEKPPRIPHGVIEEYLIRYFTTGAPQIYMPSTLKHRPFPVRFFQADLKNATRILRVNDKNGTVEEISKEVLTRIIHEALGMFAIEDHPCNVYCLSHAHVKNLSERLMACGTRLEKWPEPCGFKSTPGLFFRRLDFDPVEKASPEQFPTINLNLSHMKNAKSFCERVGSLYDPEANRKQILFLVGKGDGGKTTLMNLLTYLSGGVDGIASVNESVYKSFGLDPLLDKRVWIGEELGPKFFKNSEFKRLTGGAPVLINRKKEKQFNAHLNGMLFATANETPEIDDDSGLRNRIILCHTESIPEDKRLPPQEAEKRMREELRYFIGYCIQLYSQVGGDGTLQPESVEMIEDVIAEGVSDMGMIFDEFFVEDPSTIETPRMTVNEYSKIWEKICFEYPSFAKRNTKRRFDNYIKTRLGLTTLSKQLRRPGGKVRLIPGLAQKLRTFSGFQTVSGSC